MFGQARQRLASSRQHCAAPAIGPVTTRSLLAAASFFSTTTAPWLTPLVLRNFSDGAQHPDSFHLVAKGHAVPRAPRPAAAIGPSRSIPALPVPHDVKQALFMATRIGVLSDCPVRIKTKVIKDLPHSDDPLLTELRHQVLEVLGLGANRSYQGRKIVPLWVERQQF
jgi:hypothetical protein